MEAQPTPNAAPAFDASKLKGLGIHPLVSLGKHRRAAVFAMLCVILLGSPLAWIKGKPKYTATATVQVAARYMKNLTEDKELDFQSNSQYRQFVVNQTHIVNRYDVVEQALKDLGPKRGVWQKKGESDRKAIERLQGQLLVITVPDTYLMEVSLESGDKYGLDLVVNAVVKSYLERSRDEQLYGSDGRVDRLLDREKALLKEINQKTARRTTISLELGITSFSELAGSPYDKLLADSRSASIEARNLRYQAEARNNAFVANRETDTATRSIKDTILADPGLGSLKAGLNNRRAVLLMILSGLTPQHPAGLAARAELAEMDAEIARQSATLTRDITDNLRARYALTVEQTRSYEQDLDRVLKEQQDVAINFARLFNEAVTLSNELVPSRKELDSVRERLNFFSSERGAIGFVRLVTEALAPETPFGPGRKKLLMLVLAASLLAALVLPVAIDLTDRRIRSVSDAERTLGLPALGWLVERNGIITEMLAEDQLRRLAAGLLRERERHGASVFGLCGVKPGAGASGITLKLANALTSMGFPTLAVEANAFSSDPRYDSARPGLVQCLDGSAGFDAAIVPASGALPDRIRVGSSPLQRHLGSLERLDALLADWSRTYRFILVDMPPLLLSADAEILINRLGQSLLVVEANAINKGELARAARVLESTSAKAIGVIVSRIAVLEGSGYLHEMMIEQATGKKFSDFQTLPVWKLKLQMMVPLSVYLLIERIASRIEVWQQRRNQAKDQK